MATAELRHSIKVVARRTGLTPHVLRVWEKRYANLHPERSRGNQRLYTEDDVQRLLLLRRALEDGHAIRNVAHLTSPELVSLIGLETKVKSPAGRSDLSASPAPRSAPELVTAAYSAVSQLDAAELERVLEEATVALGQVALLTQVVSPLVQQIGQAWQEGSLRVAHEHLASAVIRTFLGQVARPMAVHPSAPTLIATTPAGQVHELGAVLVAAAASSHGWRVVFLGASLPAEEIVGAVQQSNARAVALSVVHPANDPRLVEEFLRLGRLLPPGVSILVGGRAAGGYTKALSGIGAIVCDSLVGFTDALDGLWQGHN